MGKICFSRNFLWSIVFSVAFLRWCDPAIASAVATSYNESLSVNAQIRGLTDGAGNPINTLPSDLSIIGRAFKETGSGFLASLFGANVTGAQSSFTGSGNVIVGSGTTVGPQPSGPGPLPIRIGDGFSLGSAVIGGFECDPTTQSCPDPSCDPATQSCPQKRALVSSDISQSGEIEFLNSSLSTTYLADIIGTWSFDLTAENNSSPEDNVVMHVGFGLDFQRRPPGGAGATLSFINGFLVLMPGEVLESIGSDSFATIFPVAPGEQIIFQVLPFIEGIAAVERSLVPEPPIFALFGLAVIATIVCGRRNRWPKTAQDY
jgi:hypothetical protein